MAFGSIEFIKKYRFQKAEEKMERAWIRLVGGGSGTSVEVKAQEQMMNESKRDEAKVGVCGWKRGGGGRDDSGVLERRVNDVEMYNLDEDKSKKPRIIKGAFTGD